MEYNATVHYGERNDTYTLSSHSKAIDLKKKISEKIGIPVEEQALFNFFKFVSDDDCVDSLEKYSGRQLFFDLYKKDEVYNITITIKDEDDSFDVKTLMIADNMTIELIKSMILHKLYYSNNEEEYYLFSDSIELYEDKMAKDYNLREKGSITVYCEPLLG